MSILLRNRRVGKRTREQWNEEYANKKLLEMFLDYYEECYGEPTFSNFAELPVIEREEVEYIYGDYIGFEDVTLDELIFLLGENYHINY